MHFLHNCHVKYKCSVFILKLQCTEFYLAFFLTTFLTKHFKNFCHKMIFNVPSVYIEQIGVQWTCISMYGNTGIVKKSLTEYPTVNLAISFLMGVY